MSVEELRAPPCGRTISNMTISSSQFKMSDDSAKHLIITSSQVVLSTWRKQGNAPWTETSISIHKAKPKPQGETGLELPRQLIKQLGLFATSGTKKMAEIFGCQTAI
jgi:hypothetical protein